MSQPVPPGGVIGILGGGQLGRMTALAAATLGYRTHVLTPEADSPAGQVAAACTVASFDDTSSLERFAASIDVATLEWENVPVTTLDYLASRIPVDPGSSVLAVTQDRIAEKRFAHALGIPTTQWQAVASEEEAVAAVMLLGGGPVLLKTTRLGYDGRGQARIERPSDAAKAWERIGSPLAAIAEKVVPFVAELSVVLARGRDGNIVAYPAVQNTHEHGILRQTLAPASLSPMICEQASTLACQLADALSVVGILAVEFFVLGDGGLLMNEMAPRPHNSGHWTIDAAGTSQFTQLVRAVVGLPLGDLAPISRAVMTNLIGDDVNAWPQLMAEPGARVHLYGKSSVRPGRKMGHVTRLQ